MDNFSAKEISMNVRASFRLRGGEGGFTDVSGTTAFFNRILFEKLEAGKARAVGYTSWPKITYTLP